MRAQGNGLKQVCVQNLLAIVRGEVPFDRIRGLDSQVIDSPGADAADELRQDAAWLLRVYEPRATVESIDICSGDPENGTFAVTASIS